MGRAEAAAGYVAVPMSALTNALRYLAYPALTGGAALFCYAALGWGWAPWTIGAAVVIVASVLVELLEHVIPYSQAWVLPRRLSSPELRTDLWHYAVSNRFVDIGGLAALAACIPLGAKLSGWAGVSVWPHTWPLLAQAALALVAFDLVWYWNHRLEHSRPLFWRVHSVHHSAPRMYWWNLSRNHPLDNFLSTFFAIGLLATLGAGEASLAMMAAFSGAHGLLQHANIDLRTGWLDTLFTTARVHRWHHSPRLDDSQANYGPTLTLWDFVFGTRRFDPNAVPPEDCGPGPMPIPYPTDFYGQLRAPFITALWSYSQPDPTNTSRPVAPAITSASE